MSCLITHFIKELFVLFDFVVQLLSLSCYNSINSTFSHVFHSVRIVYEFCCKGRDLNIWFEAQQTPNDTEINSIDELATIINDYIINHIKKEVLKVKLRKKTFFLTEKNEFNPFHFSLNFPDSTRK